MSHGKAASRTSMTPPEPRDHVSEGPQQGKSSGRRTHETTTEILQNRQLEASGMRRTEDGSRVTARRDPDGQSPRNEDQVGRGAEEVEAVTVDTLLNNLQQGDGEGDFTPARSEGGQPCRGVLVSEERSAGIIGLVVNDSDGAAN
jgi:hypothetical protein